MLKTIKNKYQSLRTWMCKRNHHRFQSLFKGYPAFSQIHYELKLCDHCRNTEVKVDPLLTRPLSMPMNINFVKYNSRLSLVKQQEAKQLLYEINRYLVNNKQSQQEIIRK